MMMEMKKIVIIMKFVPSERTVPIVLRGGGNFVLWNSFLDVGTYLRNSGN